MEAARALGWTAEGIEIDADAVARARHRFPGLPVARQDLRDPARRRPRSFEFVCCSELIERVADFHGFARDLAALLAPGGILFLTIPDAGHFRVPPRFIAWSEVTPPKHLNYFTRHALACTVRPAWAVGDLPFRWKTGMHVVARRV